MMQLIKQQLKIEYERYYRTRYGKIAAIVICYLLFNGIQYFLKTFIPYLMISFSSKITYMIVMLLAVITVTVIYNFSMYFIYTKKIPFFEQYRVNKDKPWPWQQNPQNWKKLLKKSIITTILHLIIVAPLLLFLSINIEFYVVMDMELAPSFIDIIPQLIIMHIGEDLFFYSTHWALHRPFLYKYHKIHHQYTTTISTAGVYSHIIEFLISNTIPLGIYLKIAAAYSPMHVTTVTIWTVFRMIDAYSGHSGYMFSWLPLQLLPFCTNDDFHDFHHSHNSGNYGSQFRFLDILFGTSKEFKAYKQSKKLKIQ